MNKKLSLMLCAAAALSMPIAAQANPAESIRTGAERVNANFGGAAAEGDKAATDNVPLIIAAILAGAAALFLIIDSNGDDAPVSP